MIEAIRAFSLERHAGPYSEWPARSRLFFENRDTGRRLDGYTIEAQFRVDDRYLVVTSCDCPFEELTTFYLLDERFRVRSRVSQGWAYNGRLLSSITPESATTFLVDFYEEKGWRLTVRRRRPWGIGRLLSLDKLAAL